MTYHPNAPTVRKVMSKRLKPQEVESLEGAMLFEPYDLDEAIVGVIDTPEGAVALYDYDALCRVFCREGEEEDFRIVQQYAQEYVDYNLVRSLPHIRPRGPRIGLWVNNEDGEEYGDDVEYIRHRGKIYVRL